MSVAAAVLSDWISSNVVYFDTSAGHVAHQRRGPFGRHRMFFATCAGCWRLFSVPDDRAMSFVLNPLQTLWRNNVVASLGRHRSFSGTTCAGCRSLLSVLADRAMSYVSNPLQNMRRINVAFKILNLRSIRISPLLSVFFHTCFSPTNIILQR